jgi:thiol-disulfide isomerase/thioredoxin
MTPATARLPIEGNFPSLAGATAWLNSPPLTPEGLRGKVVLADIWTYTCINWLRTLPYVRAWAAKFKDQGVVVIGVHSPEFELEKDLENVRRSNKAMMVDIRSRSTATWPSGEPSTTITGRLYLIDAKGKIRYHQLARASTSGRKGHPTAARRGGGRGSGLDAGDARGPEVAATGTKVQETTRTRAHGGLAPGGAAGAAAAYAAPPLKLNQWARWRLDGGERPVALHKAPGRIAYRFHARDLHLVMGPPGRGTPVRFRVLIDGKPPGAAHGTDVDADGNGTAGEQRLYQLIRQPGTIADHEFEIQFLDPGVEAFAFTFG